MENIAGTDEVINNSSTINPNGIRVERSFTDGLLNPFNTVSWDIRDAVITDSNGNEKFRQDGVEVPSFWSDLTTNIVAEKYFRVVNGEKESSARQMISRVCNWLKNEGIKQKIFHTKSDADAFHDELAYMLLHQMYAFNSPVWFNVGAVEDPQCSACQPYHALVSTPKGMVPIGDIVSRDLVGLNVFDKDGITRVVATKNNGEKPVYRVNLANGSFVEATADHKVYASSARRGEPQWLQVSELSEGMRLHSHRRYDEDSRSSDKRDTSEAALAGWLFTDGFVGQYDIGTNKSLTVEFETVNDDEFKWVTSHLRTVFPDIDPNIIDESTYDDSLTYRRIRAYGKHFRDFVYRWELDNRRLSKRVPSKLYNAPLDEVRAFLKSVFQADGYVSIHNSSAIIGLQSISRQFIEGVQLLLTRLGIFSRWIRKNEVREDRHDGYCLTIGIAGERAKFAELVGFVGSKKESKLLDSLMLEGRQCPDVREEAIVSIDMIGAMPVYDIQTESGNYLSNGIVVHNCFIQSVDDTMGDIMDLAKREVMLFKGGSGTGANLSTLRSSWETLSGGGVASGPVSFMEGYDAFAGATKSGGTTRRAAKMNVLNMDHPDVYELRNGRSGFIQCKSDAENLAHDLYETGKYSAEWNSPGNVYDLVGFQNANHSVRAPDSFMKAVEGDGEWSTRYRDGSPHKTYRARDLFDEIGEAAWICGDPGMQFDDNTNNWHTCKESGRINASNPCCFVGETLVETTIGRVAIEDLAQMANNGEDLPMALSYDFHRGANVKKRIKHAWKAGNALSLVRVVTQYGMEFICTPEHNWYLANGKTVQAQNLTPGSRIAIVGPSKNKDRICIVEQLQPKSEIPVYDIEVEGTHNFRISCRGYKHSFVVSNSEYLFLDNTACNLGSLNLLEFCRNNKFDIGEFRQACNISIIAKEIIVDGSSYPSELIAKNSHTYRTLGLGYSNLGALLTYWGIPYDSEEGRSVAAAITSIMCASAYRQSAEMAKAQGPFPAYNENKDHMLNVMKMHADSAQAIPSVINPRAPRELFSEARSAWNEVIELGDAHGYRNAQTTVIAPTGTISFLMGCITTGIEPSLGCVVYKKVVGEGLLMMPNDVVGPALINLGYDSDSITRILDHIRTNGNIHSAPDFDDENHGDIFAESLGDHALTPEAHVDMMAAVQPFISGGISKTVNMPSTSTPKDVSDIYMRAWKKGLKCIAIYRDGCKLSQPISTKLDHKDRYDQLKWGDRLKLPKTRTSKTHKFSVGGVEGYINAGTYPDGSVGEIFLTISKQGSFLSGIVDAFATSMSYGLQHGASLDELVEKFKGIKFDPSGFTDDPDIPMADSIVDYVAKWLDKTFVKGGGVVTDLPEEVPAPQQSSPSKSFDGPPCNECGALTVRSGTCYVCTNCAETTGCS